MIYHALELRVPLNFEKKTQPQGRGFELGERESVLHTYISSIWTRHITQYYAKQFSVICGFRQTKSFFFPETESSAKVIVQSNNAIKHILNKILPECRPYYCTLHVTKLPTLQCAF